MGGGERGTSTSSVQAPAWARRWEEKIWLPIPEKYQHWNCEWGYFFGERTMALAILHNVIIGHFCIGIVVYKRGENVL